MGDIADLYDAYDEIADEEFCMLQEYFNLGQTELIKRTGFVRSEKLKSIRRQGLKGRKLSEKQIWCLCFALKKHDER